MTVYDIFSFLDSVFPVNTAMDFDNVGILVGNENDEVKKALISLDCTFDTISTAKANGCNLIITHHPVIFEPLKSMKKGSLVYELLKENISVISMHTNLDVCKGGVNSALCKVLELQNIDFYTVSDGYVLQKGEVAPISPDSFAEFIKQKLSGQVKYVGGKDTIKTVLVCSGSGGDFIHEAISGGFDALVTADVKHHQFLKAFDNNICLFDAGHFNTEDIVIEPLKELLCNKFCNIEFITTHKSNIKYK